MNQILQYLQKNGERLDAEIAAASGIPLDKTRLHLHELAAKGEIMVFHSTRFIEGKKIEGMRCRIAGFSTSGIASRKSKPS